MGRYSRKDMIEFAKFAKSWSTPRNVEKAYERYLKGDRLVNTNFKKEVVNNDTPNLPDREWKY